MGKRQLDNAIYQAKRKIRVARATAPQVPWEPVRAWLLREADNLDEAVNRNDLYDLNAGCRRLGRAFTTLLNGVNERTFRRDFRA